VYVVPIPIYKFRYIMIYYYTCSLSILDNLYYTTYVVSLLITDKYYIIK